MTAERGQKVQDNWTVEPWQDSQDMAHKPGKNMTASSTADTEELEQDRWDRKEIQYSRDRTTGTGQSGQNSRDRMTGQSEYSTKNSTIGQHY